MNQVRDISLQIFNTLKEKILTLEYEPGMPINEGEICEMFSASRTPVRTAMQRLADLGLIDLLPYQQNRVSLIDLEYVRNLIYARTALEDRLLHDFIALDNPLLVEDVDHLIRKQEIIISQNDFRPEEFYNLDAGMHSIWFKALGKMGIWEFFQSSIHYTRMRILDITTMKDYQKIIDDHKVILNYIRTKDDSGLCEHMDSHLHDRLKRLEESMDKKISGYFA